MGAMHIRCKSYKREPRAVRAYGEYTLWGAMLIRCKSYRPARAYGELGHVTLSTHTNFGFQRTITMP